MAKENERIKEAERLIESSGRSTQQDDQVIDRLGDIYRS